MKPIDRRLFLSFCIAPAALALDTLPPEAQRKIAPDFTLTDANGQTITSLLTKAKWSCWIFGQPGAAAAK